MLINLRQFHVYNLTKLSYNKEKNILLYYDVTMRSKQTLEIKATNAYIYELFPNTMRTSFGSTYTKIGTIQRRLAWPLRKDDTQNREAFLLFFE